MRFLATLFCIALLFSALYADFSLTPYLYENERNTTVDTITFTTSSNTTAKLYKINGEEAMLLLDGQIVSDKAQVNSVLKEYYAKNFYPTPDELSSLKSAADAFNASRNFKTKYGPAEKTCWEGGTFLSYKSCNSITSCYQTASLVCAITGADGCVVDVLASYIYDYKKNIDGLNGAYAKFSSAYNSFSASTAAVSLSQMEEAFNSMKTSADEGMKSKLRFPETTSCMDCLGICPEPHFDYASITSGKAKVAELRTKVAPLISFDTTSEKLALSINERIKYRAGEEMAVIFKPKYDAVQGKYGGLKAQAVEAKLLVSDSEFVGAADSFLNKGDTLELKLSTRDFENFQSLLSSYEGAGAKLSAMLNNSTAAYRNMINAQDDAGDALLQAQWRVNKLSKQSVDAYNSLAQKKNGIDAQVKPPMSSSQFVSLSGKYTSLTSDAKTYITTSASYQESLLDAGNAFSSASVDGAVSLVSTMVPVSFKTRQSLAKFVPPLVVGVVDLSILAVGLMVFVGIFFYFRGFFTNRLAVSGWVLAMLAFMFVLVIGSVGFYSIALSTEKFTSFSEFMGTLKLSDQAAIIVEETGANNDAITSMHTCADQIASQLSAIGMSRPLKYYISGNKCTSMLPKASANGTVYYDTKTGLSSEACLDSMPDVPIIDLRYSSENIAPTFTTVVTEQAIIKGNDAYYGKKPMCDIANVLN